MPAVSVPAGEGTGRLHLVGRLCRRPDFVLSASVGALALALLYYGLLLRETTLHTMASKLSGQPIYVVALAALAPVALVLFGANLGLAGLLVRARARVHEQGGSLLGIMPTVPNPGNKLGEGITLTGGKFKFTDFRKNAQGLEGVMFYAEASEHAGGYRAPRA